MEITNTNFIDELPSTSSQTKEFSPISVEAKMPWLLNGKYFRIIKQKTTTEHQKNAGGIVAVCLNCTDEIKIVHGSIKVTSNFIHHLRSQHPQLYGEYLEEKKFNGRGRRRIAALKSYISAKIPNDTLIENTQANFANHNANEIERTEARNSSCSGQLENINNSDKNFQIVKTETISTENLFNSSVQPSTVSSICNYDDSFSNFFPKMSIQFDSADPGANVSKKYSIHLPVIISGKYFKIVQPNGINENEHQTDNIAAVCQFCNGGRVRTLRGSIRITSNFVRHLKSLHPNEYEEYLRERREKRKKFTYKKRQATKRFKTELMETYSINDSDNESLLEEMNDEKNTNQTQQIDSDNAFEFPTDSQDSHVVNAAVEFKDSIRLQHTNDKDIPTILNGTYFKISKKHTKSDLSIVASCQHCTSLYLTGNMHEISAFVKHLECKHPDQFQRYLTDAQNLKPSFRQTIFLEKVLKFITQNCLPPNIVETSSFTDLFESTEVEMCTAQELEMHLEYIYECHIKNFKNMIRDVEYFCTTEDIWSCEGKYFLGYTCHWIDANMKRQSEVLGFKMMKSFPTPTTVKALIQQINKTNDFVESKIICTLVDNVNDFVRTYHEFNTQSFYGNFKPQCAAMDTVNAVSFEKCHENSEGSTANHRKHDAQSLHLLAIVDYNIALKDYTILNVALNRCIDIFNKCNDNGTFVGDPLGITLIPPKDVRWTSLYASLTQLVMHKTAMDEICDRHDIEPLNALEMAFIEEFCMVLKSLVEAINFLEECDYHFGFFLPTLITIKVKLKMLHESGELKHLQNAVLQMIGALIERFRCYFELSTECNEAVVAAIACPSIKLRFVDALKETAPHISSAYLESLFVEYATELYEDNDRTVQTRETVTNENSFLCFNQNQNDEHSSEEEGAIYIIRSELYRYLNDKSKNLNSLHRYPTIKKVFEKYNTRIACSVPIEQLFHTFLDIYKGTSRQHMSCKQLEQLVLVKANKIF